MNIDQLEKKKTQPRGVIILELILTMPILLICAIAIVEFGVLLAQIKQVELASREGARLAAQQSTGTLPTSIGDVANRVERVLQTGDIPGYCRVILQHNVPSAGNPTQTTEPCECPDPTTPPLPSGTNIAAVRVTVCVGMENLAPDLLASFGFSLVGKIVSQTTTWPYIQSVTQAYTGNIYLACTIPPGPASITLVDPNTANRSVTSSSGTGTGVPPLGATDIVWDNTNQRIIYSDPFRQSIVAVDPATGDRTILSASFPPGMPVGSGPGLLSVTGLVLEPSGTLLALTSFSGLLRINPATGDRTVLSSSMVGSGPFWTVGGDTVAISAADGIYVVGRAPFAGVYEVDAVTGNRNLITADTLSTPAQLQIGNPSDAIFNASGNLLIASNLNIISVDVTTGMRTQISGIGKGTGSPIATPQGIAVQQDGTILVTDIVLEAVMAVDPITGNRTEFSGPSVGTGSNCGPGIRDLTIVP
ncbi:TadE/TadG family type IV pilus assembly protein [uncultured Gimesia sp.]|uniref:TadE/TadG family type IV pilus assembly protein n=1 Tax=uncultured Gimesia sp. TaxID=1678688 RepID=UPI0030DBFDF2|tara:strand:- start:76032 stop:77456 length:1425 start_codon:yes stop_codon:yes gene_type:complete